MIKATLINGQGPEFEHCRVIRCEVFGGDGRADGIDAMAIHALATAQDGTYCATGRLYPMSEGWRIGEIAVLEHYRGQGMGDLVARLLLHKARETYEEAQVLLNTPVQVARFFERYGFAPVAGSGCSATDSVEMSLAGSDIRLDCGG